MIDPPKEKRGPAKTALQDTELRLAYHAATLLAKLFESPFWFFEEKRTRLTDRIDNERSDR